jgi:hypothetical protein
VKEGFELLECSSDVPTSAVLHRTGAMVLHTDWGNGIHCRSPNHWSDTATDHLDYKVLLFIFWLCKYRGTFKLNVIMIYSTETVAVYNKSFTAVNNYNHFFICFLLANRSEDIREVCGRKRKQDTTTVFNVFIRWVNATFSSGG